MKKKKEKKLTALKLKVHGDKAWPQRGYKIIQKNIHVNNIL